MGPRLLWRSSPVRQNVVRADRTKKTFRCISDHFRSFTSVMLALMLVSIGLEVQHGISQEMWGMVILNKAVTMDIVIINATEFQ